MKKIIKKITTSIIRFFNRIIDQEAARVFDFDSRKLENKINKGGEQ
jgi:hypothetical protein